MKTSTHVSRRKTNSKVRIRKTNKGKGLFSLAKFKQGMRVGVVRGTLIQDPNYSSSYCVDMGGDWSLEPDAPFRFLNHSCDPNCFFEQGLDRVLKQGKRPGRLYLIALRDISIGEELTIDYQWPADMAIPCLCGTPACRGYVCDVSELPYVKQ